jgi:hypothetical protein
VGGVCCVLRGCFRARCCARWVGAVVAALWCGALRSMGDRVLSVLLLLAVQSLLTLARTWGEFRVTERPIPVTEFTRASDEGRVRRVIAHAPRLTTHLTPLVPPFSR